jgi:hypothetical protein
MTAVREAATLGGSGSPRWGEPPVLDPQFRGGSLPGYAAALAALSDAELHRLLARRPDLLSPPAPASFPELAGRAGTPASLAAALRTLDLGTLRLAELLAVLGLPATVAELAEAAGPGLDQGRLEAGLAVLAELGIALPAPDGSISGPPGLGAPFGRPGGLGPPVAELAKVGVSAERLERILANLGVPRPSGTAKAALVRAVSAALADPEVVGRAAAGADQDARRLLEEALAATGPITVMGVGYGRFAGYPDAEPASWLLERGLLLPVTYSQLVVPREAALGLRGGLVFPNWPQPPAAATLAATASAPAGTPAGTASASGPRRARQGRWPPRPGRWLPPRVCAPAWTGSRWRWCGPGRWPSATSAAWPATWTLPTRSWRCWSISWSRPASWPSAAPSASARSACAPKPTPGSPALVPAAGPTWPPPGAPPTSPSRTT